MHDSTRRDARARIAPAGLMFLAITSIGWGFNWPVTKFLLAELPPLTLRGVTGVLGAVLLALLWLPASEAALIAYTMPVWASIIAWPVLGERPTVLRTLGLVMAFAGLGSIMGGNGIAASAEKAPGIIMVLVGAFGFALGTVLSKKYPIQLPPLTAAAWQIGIGCLPISIVGLLIETTDLSKVTPLGWWLLVYSVVGQFCIAYVSWFAALARLPASVAAIGTMAVPVIGVVASAVALGEPLGAAQIAGLIFTLAAVALATR